ncbi:MAG TPA: hypothetical protein DDW52_23765 [Planctomycetaceae bacterium]|nr:hypothetical protein [Planctomycetaceae bacterium]
MTGKRPNGTTNPPVEFLELLPQGVGITNSLGVFVYTNPRFDEMFGYKEGELIGLPGHILNAPSDAPPEELTESINAAMKENGVWKGEVYCKRKDGTLFWTEARLSSFQHAVLGQLWLGVQDDISDRKSIETQLLHAQKMDAIGTMAGGIAHEFNNILAAIQGWLELTLLDDTLPTSVVDKLNHVQTASSKAVELVKQILLFSRNQSVEMCVMDPTGVLSESLHLLKATIPANVMLDLNVAEHCGCIKGNSGQFNQLAINLINNAVHALEGNSGRISVRAGVKMAEDVPMSEDHGVSTSESGQCFHLSVEDDGVGIRPEHLTKVFDPFFSTKDADQGTGLGMSVVHSIVSNHHGQIAVSSELGKGTRVDVTFPLVAQEQGQAKQGSRRQIFPGTQKILIAEDEVSLAQIYSQFLSQLGYRVATCNSGREALEMFRLSPEAYDLVLSDFDMPEMTGQQLMEEIRKMKPDLPFIISSGFCKNEATLLEDHTCVFLDKPVSLGALSETIRRSLEVHAVNEDQDSASVRMRGQSGRQSA